MIHCRTNHDWWLILPSVIEKARDPVSCGWGRRAGIALTAKHRHVRKDATDEPTYDSLRKVLRVQTKANMACCLDHLLELVITGRSK